MKNLYRNLILGLTSTLIIASCSKQIDKNPYVGIGLDQSFETMNDAKAWNAGLYAHLRGRVNGIYTFVRDVQADQLNASMDYGNNYGNPHRWGSSFLADDYELRDIWQNTYSSLKNVNAIITGYPNITPANQQQTDTLKRYLADAHFMRAFYYSRLMEYYSDAYEAASATTKLGVPLVLVYNPSEKPARATQKEVFDQILLDINTAKSLTIGLPGAPGSTRITRDAILALEARVKLTLKDYPGAKAAADELINSNRYQLYTTAAELKNYWHIDTDREDILKVFVNNTNETGLANSIYWGFQPATGKYRPTFFPSQWVVDFYDNSDFRKAIFFKQVTADVQGLDYPNTWVVNKYPGNPALFTTANTNYQHVPKVFRIAEMYLISAEADVATNPANALTTLNKLRQARGLAASTATGTANVLAEIKAERFKELAFEGFRLYDLKRWHEGFTRRNPQNTNMLTPGSNFTTLSIAADDNKFTWGIPTNDVTINPNIKQNTGW